MEERAVLDLSETFAKINDDHGKKLLKMRRSFDLNYINESSKIKHASLCKTKSLSSQFVVNFDDQTSFRTINPRSNEETGLLSICESSSSPSKLVSDQVSGASAAAVDGDESDSCSWRRIQIEPALIGISLKFEEVNYKVRLSSNVEKNILQGVSGCVFPGESLALMGPSGGGKTTLLNLLSGRMKSSGGIITYNDQLYTKSLKGRIGFVLQDDTVFPHLTVKETLTYSALLRLPNSLSKQQKNERAMDVLSQLGLESLLQD